ncbi:MAG: DDE-type integrase/transposase/recombinase, partial [Bacteroidaceae bacterium]|nr:DDE-type integrase/transposase/recombinase [Bacteroidaceae bacterium]
MDTRVLTSSQKKLVMWHKVKELKSKGLNYTQIGREVGLDRDTVRKYDRMTLDAFIQSQAYQRNFIHKLDKYEPYVMSSLNGCPYLSASQIHDWLREEYPDLPDVNSKTVYNFVKYIRAKYRIPKTDEHPRQMSKQPESNPGEYAQADFGEYWMHRNDSRRVKVYFFVMVLSSSRRKHVFFSRTPFTAEMAVYAHQMAFAFFGGKTRKILYDQDKVLISSENLG